MTRTHPPDILVSTLYQDIIPSNPITGRSISLRSPQQCDLQMIDKPEIINKRHCRSFDFIESLDDPKCVSSSMEYPYTTAGQHQTPAKDAMWNSLDQPGHLRFSSPDLFNARQVQQHVSHDAPSPPTWSGSKKKTRSKSAPRLKPTLKPVPISVSPPGSRKRRDIPRAVSDPVRTVDSHRESYSSNRAYLNDVHPIKLQPHSPLYVSDCFEEQKPDKPAIAPHVRCRVDIKPDAAVLQHTAWQVPSVRPEQPYQRYSHSSSSRGLYVPRQFASSPTPTPSECYSQDFRPGFHPFTTSVSPISYQHLDPHRMPSPTIPYLSREQRAYSNPNIPTKFFYTEDPVRYPVHPYGRPYFQDDQVSLTSHGSTMTSQYDPRTRLAHTLPVRPYYTEHPALREPMQTVYGRPYSTSEAGSYFSQTPLSRHYHEEDPRSPYNLNGSRVIYSKPFSPPAEQYVPARPYYTEGRRPVRIPQSYSDDVYRSSISSYSNQSFMHTPPTVRQEPWFANGCMEPTRLGVEVKNHSKSWDNLLNPRYERSREQSVPRGRSYENLFYQGRHKAPSGVTAQPVILNLSSSPKRYAALSLSENSLDRGSSNPWKNSKSGLWFVTPEITITDNDIRGGNRKLRDVHSVSWESDHEKVHALSRRESHLEGNSPTPDIAKDFKPNNFSLQQSLEQLDELLADLVVDYKPPGSGKSSEGLLDQLKQLISEDDEKDRESSGLQNLGFLNMQLPSSKSSPDTVKDPDSGCDGLQRSADGCSPDHSTDDDNDTMVCSNRNCKRIETLFNACLYFKSCHSCYTFYCSRNCRRDDWESHKGNCLYGRISSMCRHTLKFCRESAEIHKAFSRLAKAGYLSRGRGVLFLGFANPGTADNFLKVGLECLLMSPTYLSLRELDGFKDNLGEYCKELQHSGNEYDPNECFLLNVSIAVGELSPKVPSPRVQAPTVRKYAKVSLASSSPEKKLFKKDSEMETLILTPPPGTPDIDQEGEGGRKAREVCFVNIQRQLRTRGVFLRHEYPKIYTQLCEFVERNQRFTPTTIYPIDKRTGRQFMCMIMAASEPRTLDWVGSPNLLDDII
ncbi:apical junction component 1 homolog [Gadus chalcogrammus]|uniref:apical junction component 1 homolog n=1 Tax=Gadus chalcogrammus TaxID=1042646 RepID=UPI0024C2FE6C|nr:apical junction component 1 homolog [Gadus chalcogrammus]